METFLGPAGRDRSKTNDFKSKLACILEASESTKIRIRPYLTELQLYNLAHKFYSCASSHADSRSKSSSGLKKGRNWKRFRRGTWRTSEVRERWSMKQRRRAQKFNSLHWWTSVIWRKPNWRQSTKNTKVELYAEETLWNMILDLMQYSQSKAHQHHRWRQQKSWILSPCQVARDKQQTQYGLIPKSKMEDAPKLLKIPNRNFQTFGFVHHDKWPKSWSSMEDPVVPLERNLYGHPLARLVWGKQFEKSYWNMAGRKFQIGNVSLNIMKKDSSHLCMWMT